MFRNMVIFYSEESKASHPTPQARGPPLVSCLWLFIQYICSYPPYLRPFLHVVSVSSLRLVCRSNTKFHLGESCQQLKITVLLVWLKVKVKSKFILCIPWRYVGQCRTSIHSWSWLWMEEVNPLTMKRNQLYIRNQSVPRSKHFSPRL